MEVKVIGDATKAGDALRKLFIWADERSVEIAYAWARTNEGRADHWYGIDMRKLKRAVIGTQFAQTEPWALERLRTEIGNHAKVMLDSEGTFHPKIAIARRGDEIRVLMGSSNLTPQAFSTNTELNVLFEGDATDPSMRKFTRFFDNAWKDGCIITDEWLERYRLAYARRPRPAGSVPGARLSLQSIDDLEISWRRYRLLIEAQEGRTATSGFRIPLFVGKVCYLNEFKRMQQVFADNRTFAALSPEERELAIGIGDSSGLLGRMMRPYLAKRIIEIEPQAIGRYLDRIPVDGDVSLMLARDVLQGLYDIKGIAVGVASRLLVAKRPDLFLSVNEGSRPALSPLAGSALKTVDQYMSLLERIWQTPWFRSNRPEGQHERHIWDRRVAILDAAVYEGNG